MTAVAHGTEAAGPLASANVMAGKALRVFVRTPQLVGATLGQGVLFLLVFRYVFGGAIDTGQLTYIDFMTPGILTAGILFAAAGAGVAVAQDRVEGFADRVLSLPASRAGLVAGRVLADTVVVVGAVAVTLAAAVAVGYRSQASILEFVSAGGLLVLYAMAFAALFGWLGWLADGPQTAQSLGFLAIPLTFVSSAYVPTGTMPSWLATVAHNQPVTHMIDALRHLLHADRLVPEQSQVWLLAVLWATAILCVSVVGSMRRLPKA